MKRFSFSLQKLLDYKEQLFDIERTILGDMRAALNRMLEELENLKKEHADRSRAFNEKAAAGTSVQEIELHKVYMRMIDYNIEQKIMQIDLQRRAIDKQTDKVREAKIEISTMEKLKERKIDEYNYKAMKADELFIDEFVNNKRAASQESA